MDALHRHDHGRKSPRVHVDTLTKRRERSISSPVAKGTSVKRAIYVSRKDAIRAEVRMNLAAKEIHAVRAACAGPMECVRPAADMSSHAVKTIPAARVSCVALIQNATSAEGTIRPVVKGMFARNGLSVVQMGTVIPAEAMMTPVVKEMCAKRVTSAEQRENASHVEATTSHAV